MNKIIQKLTLILIFLFIFFCVYTAFVGAQKAQDFFNSIPLVIYWFFGVVLTIAAIMSFKKLRKPELFLMHFGFILIILGSVIASEKGHNIQSQIFGIEKPVTSQMIIFQGQSNDGLYEKSKNQNYRLPFQIRLNKFIVENYQPYLIISLANGITVKAPVEFGNEYAIGGVISKIKILRTFENFKIDFDANDNRTPIDANSAGRNPAVEIEITKSDGTVSNQFIFELFKGHQRIDEQFHITYHRPVKDYISKVDIIKEGKVVKSADIEVNHPLHYAGFHFYQYSYDNKHHQYTVLQVVSDSGLNVVFLGFAALYAGILWYFWLIKLRKS